MVLAQRSTIGRLLEKNTLSEPLRKKRVNRSDPFPMMLMTDPTFIRTVPNDDYDGPNIYPNRSQ